MEKAEKYLKLALLVWYSCEPREREREREREKGKERRDYLNVDI